MRKNILGVLLCTAMTVGMLTGCGSESDKGSTNDSSTATSTEATPIPTNAVAGDAEADDAFVVWGWNEDIKKILDGPFKKDNPDDYKRIVFVNTAGSDFYQAKLDEILSDKDNDLYPDLVGLETDYVLKYVNDPELLLSVGELGIKKSDYANQYSYNLHLGTDDDRRVKALFWQATPGSWQVRADFCKQYLGTTNPAELQKKYFSSWEKILAAAENVNEASNGRVKLLSGYTDVFRVFSNARKTGWYDSKDKGDSQAIQVDDQMKQYMDVAKRMYEEELTFNTDQWSADWEENMLGDGEETNAALAYTGCPWFTYWSLGGDGKEHPNPWVENTILLEGPQKFYWGGTGLAAPAGCADKELAGKIIKYFTCDTESMLKINALNSDFVNNKEAVKQVKNTAKCDKMFPDAKQNFMEFYLSNADGIDTSTVTAEDQDINSMWDAQVKEYVQGNKDEETAINEFKATVHDKYRYLTVE